LLMRRPSKALQDLEQREIEVIKFKHDDSPHQYIV
jgi:hypothetical protein